LFNHYALPADDLNDSLTLRVDDPMFLEMNVLRAQQLWTWVRTLVNTGIFTAASKPAHARDYNPSLWDDPLPGFESTMAENDGGDESSVGGSGSEGDNEDGNVGDGGDENSQNMFGDWTIVAPGASGAQAMDDVDGGASGALATHTMDGEASFIVTDTTTTTSAFDASSGVYVQRTLTDHEVVIVDAGSGGGIDDGGDLDAADDDVDVTDGRTQQSIAPSIAQEWVP
jgi:hypothetical protein